LIQILRYSFNPSHYSEEGNRKSIRRGKDNLVIIAGKNKKDYEYLIPKTKVDHYDDKQVYLIISDDSLKEFEI
jgi:hypothetical protein